LEKHSKTNSTDKISILVSITMRLSLGQELTTAELAEKYDVKLRTMQRYMKFLNEKLPLEKRQNHWRMKRDVLHHTALNEADYQVIDILETMAEDVGGSFAARSKKLLNSIHEPEINTFYAKLNLEDISGHVEEISRIEEGIRKNQFLTFDYENDGKIREEAPLKIMNDQGYWYLVTYSFKYSAIKKYHLKSVGHIAIKKEKFDVPKDLDKLLENAVNIWFSERNEPFEVRLFVKKEFAKYFYRKPIGKTQKIEPHQDGSIDVVVTVTHHMEVLPIIKSMMPNVLES